ncbi:MAG: HlyD family efflux transporter periplasmic adaptor subunit [Pseudomonadota bacterium]
MTLRKTVAFVILFAAFGAAGYFYWEQQNAFQLPNGLAMGNGRIEAVQVNISTKFAGRLADISVREGDMVSAGDSLAKMDTKELMAQLRFAQANVAQAESNVVLAENQIKQRKAEFELAEHELGRTIRLQEQGFRTQAQADRAITVMKTAEAALHAASASLIRAQRAVEAAIAEEERIDTIISEATLVAPVNGRVLYRLAEPGEILSSGGRVLTLVDLSDIYMEVFLPASEAHQVTMGSEARIKLDVLDVAIPAKVTFVSPVSQFTPKQVETLVEREKLMFRVKVTVPQELVQRHIDRVKTGVRGVAYIQYSTEPDFVWPDFLQRLPEGGEPQTSSLLN